MSVDRRGVVVERMSTVGEVEWLGHTVVKLHGVVVERVWSLLVFFTPVIERVVEIHESFQSMPSLG